MALAILLEIPGLTRDQYEGVTKKVMEAGRPQGSTFHAGGPIEGGYRLIEVWESREAADAFYSSELLKKATVGHEQPKVIMTWPVVGVDVGSGWKPAS
jgi:hypothetical protein